MDRVERLRALGEDGLERLLRRRPDVLVGRSPRTLRELASRLDSFPSVTAACAGLTAPQLQVLVAARALGDRAGVPRLAGLLGGDPRPQLRDLADLDLLAFEGDDVRTTPEVRHAVPDLLTLGYPFADLAPVHSLRSLQRAEAALGLPRSATPDASRAALQEFYDDADRVRDHAEWRLPPGTVSDLLDRAARVAAGVRDEDVPYVPGRTAPWDRDEMVDQIGLETGLMVGDVPGWRGSVFMPAEVALALRGPRYRVAFHPEPPAVAWLPVSRTESDAAAAVAALDSAATAVLDQVAAHPVTALRAGGVGRRELQRLAKATSTTTGTVMLVLELAMALRLLDDSRRVTVTDEFVAWRDSEPAERVVALLTAWWAFAGRPGDERDADGGNRAALTGAACNGCASARHALLVGLRPDAGVSLADARNLAGWHAPNAHLAADLVDVHWREALEVGAVAQGALTPLGTALVAGDPDALLTAAGALLPASTSEAVFGSDLTAFVAGSPSSRVSGLLDACAVRESGGGAVTWRMSSASVRRALDDGLHVEELRSSLRGIAAGGGLPSAVEVLLDDVARVHGRAVVRTAAGVVVSDDETLLVQMVHDRKLAALELERVAPTVLVAGQPPQVVAKTLRDAGYMPAWTGPGPDPEEERATVSWRRSVDAVGAISRSDPSDLARALLRTGGVLPESSPTEDLVRELNPLLNVDEVAVLAHAIDTRSRVHILYESGSGGITERVVRPTDVLGDRMWAWCELRRDDREFLLERVLGVRGV